MKNDRKLSAAARVKLVDEVATVMFDASESWDERFAEVAGKIVGTERWNTIGTDFAYWAASVCSEDAHEALWVTVDAKGRTASAFVEILKASLPKDHHAFEFIVEEVDGQ